MPIVSNPNRSWIVPSILVGGGLIIAYKLFFAKPPKPKGYKYNKANLRSGFKPLEIVNYIYSRLSGPNLIQYGDEIREMIEQLNKDEVAVLCNTWNDFAWSKGIYQTLTEFMEAEWSSPSWWPGSYWPAINYIRDYGYR